MKHIFSALAGLICFGTALHAAEADELLRSPEPVALERPVSRPVPRSFKWSLAPLVASQTLDVTSSYGMRELNPALAGADGRFGPRSAALKLGLTGALVGVEYLVVKIHPGAARFFTSINWSGAALTTGFAVHNFSIR
ncbi:MAG TPA: hypothetical protein VGN17_24055 [Bryobacteraceae bacterium]|jgi:hypothetical protein